MDFKSKYNNYRIAVLEKEMLKDSSVEKIREYKNSIENLIKSDDISNEEKTILLKMVKEHFGY